MKYYPGMIRDSLSPEMKLLVNCLRRDFSSGEEVIADLAGGDFNWDLFLDLAFQHSVYPQVSRVLSAVSSRIVPERVTRLLADRVRVNNSFTLRMIIELRELLMCLERNGVRSVVLKGFPLAYKLYDNIALRPSCDLDILVRPEDFPQACRIAEEKGYVRIRPEAEIEEEELHAWMRQHHTFDYWHPDKQISLEMHWRVGSHGIDLDYGLIEKNLIGMNFTGHTVTVLDNEVLFLFLISHGAGHAWSSFRWLQDIDAFMQKIEISWIKLSKMAEELEATHYLHQALILAQDLLGTTLPPDIDARVSKDKRAQSLADLAIKLATSPGYHERKIDLFSRVFILDRRYRMGLLNGSANRLAFLWSTAVFYFTRLWLRIAGSGKEMRGAENGGRRDD